MAFELVLPPIVGPPPTWATLPGGVAGGSSGSSCSPSAQPTWDLPELFAAAAEAKQAAVAVTSELDGAELTFAQLRCAVNGIAEAVGARLRGAGQRPWLVAVCLRRTPALPAALLGVLGAGAGYVPIDPEHPESRRRFLLEDSGARALITSKATRWQAGPFDAAVAVLHVSEPAGALESSSSPAAAAPAARAEGEKPTWEVDTSDETPLAYLIYTSGSTGAPKGVRVPRPAVVNVLHAFDAMLRGGRSNGEIMRSEEKESRTDCLVSVTTCCFDISALEFFWPLCFGFRLHLASPATARSGPSLAAVLESVRPTLFQATPATYRSLLAAGWTGSSDLTGICGGEALQPGLATRLRACCGGGLWNAYGPTEATVWCSAHSLPACAAEASLPASAEPLATSEAVPIGKPLAGDVLLLARTSDADAPEANEASASHVGELLVAGLGVALGYHRRPELTAARFVPCIGEAASCVADLQCPPVAYRTGDLVRVPAAGCDVEFIGRIDNQLKVRGFRVEPGEIESVLEQHPGVQAAAVVVVQGQSDSEQATGPVLVAYAVAPDDKASAAAADFRVLSDDASQLQTALRSHLANKLPTYMVPRHIILVSELPVLSSGKVDRNALRDRTLPKSSEAAEQSGGLLPGSSNRDLLRQLAAIDWRTADVSDHSGPLLREAVASLVLSVTGQEAPDEEDVELASLGIDSVGAVELAELLSRCLLGSREVPLEDIYVYRTLDALCGYVRDNLRDKHNASSEATSTAPSAAAPDTRQAQRKPAPKQVPKHKQRATQAASKAAAAPQSLPDPGLEACRVGDLSALRSLITSGRFNAAEARDRFGGSGLHWAAGAGHLEVCQLLVSSGAAPGFADKKSGRCALHWSSRQGHLPVVEWLVSEHGQSVNVETKDQTTPIQLAAWGDHVEVCAWLLKRGASLDHRNRWYCLSHHFAALAGSMAACKWLHTCAGVDLGLGNDQGHNALHKAAYGGHQELCRWLQDEVGLDRCCIVQDARGQTPIDLARKAGYEELALWLADRAGANSESQKPTETKALASAADSQGAGYPPAVAPVAS
eukprot:TRINITY_DN22700_c0_g3_i1.p1 TRINITY_DN22700_c0_g3~~TRINITY_DN22700_c0_g3_i1.p1  ORF type:complete len:1073 (-),score=214.95 TRINITY_DN22700_c0_g3_i1:265-3438(-)